MTEFTENQRNLIRHWLNLPRDIHPLVPRKSSLLLNHISKNNLHIALASWQGKDQLLVEYLDQNLTGSFYKKLNRHNAFDVAEKDAWPFLNAHWQTVMTTPCASIILYRITNHAGEDYMLTSLHLPLCNEKGLVDKTVVLFEDHRHFFIEHASKPDKISLNDIKECVFIDIGHPLDLTNPAFDSRVSKPEMINVYS